MLGALLIVGSIGLRSYRRFEIPLPAAVATTWVMWLLIGYFTPRPVMFSLGLLALLLVVADEERLRWALPPSCGCGRRSTVASSSESAISSSMGSGGAIGRRIVDVAAVTLVTLFTAHGLGTWQVVLQFLGNGEALDLIIGVAHAQPDQHRALPLPAGDHRDPGWGDPGPGRDVGPVGDRSVPRFAFTANRSVPLVWPGPWLRSSSPGASRGAEEAPRRPGFSQS